MPRPTREPPKRTAKSYSLWLLSRREHSAKELLGKLTGRGYPLEEAQAAVESMKGFGLQSDERYAESQARTSARRHGDRQIAMTLAEKGIPQELAAAKMADLEPEDDRAVRMVEKFEGKTLDEAGRAKVWRFLAYRGFSGDSIKAALRHLKEVAAASGDNGG